MIQIRLTGLLLAVALFAAGCAAPRQEALPFNGQTLADAKVRVGVAMTTLPTPDTAFPGASCLLCMAAAAMMNSSLTEQVHRWQTTELAGLRDELIKLLRARGVDAVPISLPVDLAKLPDRPREAGRAAKDFGALGKADRIDKLLVVQIDALGVTRNYSAYVPTGDPRATLFGAGYLVDLPSHSLDWYEPLVVSVPAAGNWDEPPEFPALTNAYYQALELAADQLKKPLTP